MNKLVILIIGVIFYLSFLPCNSDCKEIITDSKDSTLNFTEHYIVLEFRVDMLLNK